MNIMNLDVLLLLHTIFAYYCQYLHKLHNPRHMQINYIFGKELTASPGSGIFCGILFVPGLVTLFLSSPFSICRSWPLTADAEPPMRSANGLEMTLTFTVWEESQELHIHQHSLRTKQEANTTLERSANSMHSKIHSCVELDVRLWPAWLVFVVGFIL